MICAYLLWVCINVSPSEASFRSYYWEENAASRIGLQLAIERVGLTANLRLTCRAAATVLAPKYPNRNGRYPFCALAGMVVAKRVVGELDQYCQVRTGSRGPEYAERLKAYARDPRCLKTTFVQARIRSVSLTPSVPISLLRCIHGRHSQVPYPSTWASTGGGISNAHERGGLGNQPEKPGGNRYGISRKVETEGARAVPG